MPRIITKKVVSLKTVDSTNLYCLRNIETLPSGTVVLAETQTSGRGRLGRNWHSPAGENLYASILLKSSLVSKHISSLPQLASLAVYLTITDYQIDSAWIKWPNDIFINNLKVSGILSECHTLKNRSEALVIGIGVNLNMSTEVLKKIEKPATSLSGEVNRPVDRQRFVEIMIDNFNDLFHSLTMHGHNHIHRLWKGASRLLNRKVTIIKNPDEQLEGTVIDLQSDGSILVQLTSGKKVNFLSGDISLTPVA